MTVLRMAMPRGRKSYVFVRLKSDEGTRLHAAAIPPLVIL